MLRQAVRSHWFALVDLFLVLISGAIWMLSPRFRPWPIMIALLPWGLRLIAGRRFPFQRTSLDWLILIFLLTAWVGYWAAYDRTTAWHKVWLVMIATLLYYALVAQPKENLFWVSILIFCMGVGVSLHYFLTYDFIAAPRKLEFVNRIGRWIMNVRPATGWDSIHPNYVAGLVAISAPFVFYPAWNLYKNNVRSKSLYYVFALFGLSIISLALVMATSRGVVMAIVSGLGVWLVWRFANLNGIKNRIKNEALFSSLLLVYLSVIIAFLYLGPANSRDIFSSNYYYGNGSRAELFSRSLYILKSYPITGGGLGSFPGLYSQYLLDIPFFNVPNSHNLFLDVAIEQGIFGGISFLLMYLASIWFVSRSLMHESTPNVKLFSWIILFSLVVALVHGMVDDYLFNGNGTVLSLFLVGLSVPAAQWRLPELSIEYEFDNRIIGFGLLVLALMLVLNPARSLSTWYANLGAVRLSQVELDGFPKDGWTGPAIVPRLGVASRTLQTALQLDPDNWVANQYLGRILMLSQDFDAASKYLGAAYKLVPDHRGIIKSLGYCYAWLGETNKSKALLSQIPEAQEELDVYTWWWGTQGRNDLSEKASVALGMLSANANQP